MIRSLLAATVLAVVSVSALQADNNVVSASRYLSLGETLDVPAGENVPFNDDYSPEMGGVSYNTSDKYFTLPPGCYKVSYGASGAGEIKTDRIAGLELYLGDTSVAGSRLFFFPANTVPHFESNVLYLEVPDVNEEDRQLSLRVVGVGQNPPFTFLSNAADGRVAYMTIKKIGDLKNNVL